MNTWESFKDASFYSPITKLMVDWTGMGMDDGYLSDMSDKIENALSGMDRLDAGEVVNISEGRMVGHYWLRDASKAPTESIRRTITESINTIKKFAADVHSGKILSGTGKIFRYAVVLGVGGSSLGPIFVSKALARDSDKMKLLFMDNTDPDGIDKIFKTIEPRLDETLIIAISKSGGTIEMRNCMEEVRNLYTVNGLNFPQYAVCITKKDSKLYKLAVNEGWVNEFLMWGWVGGRTSVMSAVGLVPLALKGIDIDEFLRGAADCDELDRNHDVRKNPAALVALSWYRCSGGKGGENMVVLPYKDSLALFPKYLQQLIMESIGKELDNDGNLVKQGIVVLGSKGSSDQHSYLQQLIAGPDNVFVVFVQALQDRRGPSTIVGEDSTAGEYLNAFMLGTKKALESHGKRTITVTIPDVDAYNVGQLIAVFERAVGIYANLINVNAYDQPAVEIGKKAANGLISVKNRSEKVLAESDRPLTACEIAEMIDASPEDVFRLMLHKAVNYGDIRMEPADDIWESRFSAKQTANVK